MGGAGSIGSVAIPYPFLRPQLYKPPRVSDGAIMAELPV